MNIKILIPLLLSSIIICACEQEETINDIVQVKLSEIDGTATFIHADKNSNKYYLYTNQKDGIKLYHSKDLEKWNTIPTFDIDCAQFGEKGNAKMNGLYAYNGKYYLIVTVKSDSKSGLAIFESSSPDGQFAPLADHTVTPLQSNCEHGSMFVDNKGTPWLVYTCSENGNSQVMVQQLSKDISSLCGDAAELVSAPTIVAPMIHAIRSGVMQLTWCELDEAGHYIMRQAVSQTGKTSGPWAVSGETIVESEAEIPMIFTSLDGKVMILRHPSEEAESSTCISSIYYYNNIFNTEPSKADLIKERSSAVFVLSGEIRDPYIVLGPDGNYYMSSTRPAKYFPNQMPGIQIWESPDLISWKKLPVSWTVEGSAFGNKLLVDAQSKGVEPGIWAPEAHFFKDKWHIVNCSNLHYANILISKGENLEPPFTEPMGDHMGDFRDPSFFVEDNGSVWVVADCASVTKLNDDMTGFSSQKISISPANRSLGHEGCQIIKFEGKYVLLGTGWSTDKMRKGTYNLYYCTSDNITGPYGNRKFAGRCLGHGNLFQDKSGNWWCTAFYNADYDTVPKEEFLEKDVSGGPYTMNEFGLTLVPMDIRMVDGEVQITALDTYYSKPGPEEAQQF